MRGMSGLAIGGDFALIALVASRGSVEVVLVDRLERRRSSRFMTLGAMHASVARENGRKIAYDEIPNLINIVSILFVAMVCIQ